MAKFEVAMNASEPLYGQRLLPVVLRDVSRLEPNKPWGLTLEGSEASQGFRTVSMSQMAKAVNATAWWMQSEFGRGENSETLAYIGISDLRYQIVHLASIMCGYKGSRPEGAVLWFDRSDAG